MPIATRIDDTEDFDLKSLPDGKVTLRRMTYGQKLKRQQIAMEMTFSGSARGNSAGEVKMLAEQTAIFEFGACIVSHNLTDSNEVLLNFTNPVDVQRLDGKVGEEISNLISKMNNFEEEDENSPGGNS